MFTPSSSLLFRWFSRHCRAYVIVALSVTALAAGLPLAQEVSSPRLINISTRSLVLTGGDVMIGGFVVGGTTPKKVLITARGPSLAALGVVGALEDPKVELFSGQVKLLENDNWQSQSDAAGGSASAAEIAALGVFPAGPAPSNPLESALLVTLNPGSYTAIVSGAGRYRGVGIVEVFEVGASSGPLVNISTRGQVQTGNNVLIGGFAIAGSSPQTVLIVARGLSLSQAGIGNPLPNPKLEIFSGQTRIYENDNWQDQNLAAGGPAARDAIAALGTFPNGVRPSNANEAALQVTLEPGLYTAIVSPADGVSGVGILEIYDRVSPFPGLAAGQLSLVTSATASTVVAGHGVTLVSVARSGGTQGSLTGEVTVTGGCVFSPSLSTTTTVRFPAGSGAPQGLGLAAGGAAAGATCTVTLQSSSLAQPSTLSVSVTPTVVASNCNTTANRSLTWAGGQLQVNPFSSGDVVAVRLNVADFPLTTAPSYSFTVAESISTGYDTDVQATVSNCPGDFASSLKFAGTCMIHVGPTGGAVRFVTNGQPGRLGECVLPAGTPTVYFNLRQIRRPTPTPPDAAGTASCPAGGNCRVYVNLSR